MYFNRKLYKSKQFVNKQQILDNSVGIFFHQYIAYLLRKRFLSSQYLFLLNNIAYKGYFGILWILPVYYLVFIQLNNQKIATIQIQIKFQKSNIIIQYHSVSNFAMKGLNLTNIQLTQDSINFITLQQDNLDNKLFAIPFSNINTLSVSKNDLIIKLENEKIPKGQSAMPCEIRLYVPDINNQEDKETIDNENSDDSEKKEKKRKRVEIIQQKINTLLDPHGKQSARAILTIENLSLLAPRGRYTAEFYPTTLKLHGASFNYNISYKNIVKGFILPLNDYTRTRVVLQLDEPMKQGQNSFPFIVMQATKQQKKDIQSQITKEHIKEFPHLQKVYQKYSGPFNISLVQIIQSILNIDLVVPGQHFKSAEGFPHISCSHKSEAGQLFFFKKSMIFSPKPILFFRVQDVARVQFDRYSSKNKQFDIKIFLKKGQCIQFTGVKRQQFEGINKYFEQRQVKVVKVGGDGERKKVIEESDSSEDDDFKIDEEEDDSIDSQLVSESSLQQDEAQENSTSK